jgi:hypothetical protein
MIEKIVQTAKQTVNAKVDIQSARDCARALAAVGKDAGFIERSNSARMAPL